MPAVARSWLPLLIVTLSGLWLRTADLGARPMHADEANQAFKTGELLETGRYAFDPADHHGPVLYYAALAAARLRGQKTFAQLDETTLRLVPAVAGAASILLLGILAAPLGKWTAVAAAALLAVSPPAAYYSRYFIQETLLSTFILAALVLAGLWWRTGRRGWAVGAGVCLGLMQATKETAPLFAVAAAAALLIARRRGEAPASARPVGDAWAAMAAALCVAALFYSSFGSHPAGLRDALLTYAKMGGRLAAGGTGHEKPWWYYIRLFAWQRSGGLVFEQAGFSALALAGVAAAVLGRAPLLRWAALYTGVVLACLSAVAYKTPWNAIHLVPGLALLGAGATAWAARVPLGRWGGALAFSCVLAMLALQTVRVTRAYAADERNPYAYVHSSPDVLKFRALAEAARARMPLLPVRVISEEYWPLPWYFRGIPGVGYWTRPPGDCDGALIVASADLAQAVQERMRGRYSMAYLGLRPGFVCVVYSRLP